MRLPFGGVKITVFEPRGKEERGGAGGFGGFWVAPPFPEWGNGSVQGALGVLAQETSVGNVGDGPRKRAERIFEL